MIEQQQQLQATLSEEQHAHMQVVVAHEKESTTLKQRLSLLEEKHEQEVMELLKVRPIRRNHPRMVDTEFVMDEKMFMELLTE